MAYFCEYCKTVMNRKGNLIPEEDLVGQLGFRGVYCYDEEAAILLKAQENSLGLNRFTPCSSTLFTDFDDQPEEAEILITSLKENNIGFTVYDSGNRSVHIHIPHVFKSSKSLPYTHMKILEKLGVNLDKIDTTLYRNHSIYRLEGTKHSKTGKTKVALYEVEGDLLDFNIIEAPTKSIDYTNKGDQVNLEHFLDVMYKYLINGAGTGSRYGSFFNIACCAAEVGLSTESTVNLIKIINDGYENPHPDSEIHRAVEGGYEFISRR